MSSAAPARVRVASSSFEPIVTRYWSRVFGYVRMFGRNQQDAEDSTADTFERAYRAWTDGHAPGNDLLPWLFVIARRLVIDRERRRRLVHWVPLVTGARPEPADGGRLTEPETAAWFLGLQHVLPARQYEALILRYAFDLSYEQIARLMSVSAGGARTLVARALSTLRRHPEVLT